MKEEHQKEPQDTIIKLNEDLSENLQEPTEIQHQEMAISTKEEESSPNVQPALVKDSQKIQVIGTSPIENEPSAIENESSRKENEPSPNFPTQYSEKIEEMCRSPKKNELSLKDQSASTENLGKIKEKLAPPTIDKQDKTVKDWLFTYDEFGRLKQFSIERVSLILDWGIVHEGGHGQELLVTKDNNYLFLFTYHGHLKQFSIRQRKLIIDFCEIIPENRITSFQLSKDQQLLFTTDNKGFIHKISIADQKIIQYNQIHKDLIFKLYIRPDSEHFVANCKGATIK